MSKLLHVSLSCLIVLTAFAVEAQARGGHGGGRGGGRCGAAHTGHGAGNGAGFGQAGAGARAGMGQFRRFGAGDGQAAGMGQFRRFGAGEGPSSIAEGHCGNNPGNTSGQPFAGSGRERFKQGLASGELTPFEAHRLHGQRQRIQETTNRFKQSGEGINPFEQNRLQQMNQNYRENLFAQKHDRQDMPWAKDWNQNIPEAGMIARNKEHRIKDGKRSGELTPQELKALNKQQEHIQNTAERFKESGNGINPIEQKRLQEMRENYNKNLFAQKHDRQDMPWAKDWKHPKNPEKIAGNQENRIEQGIASGELTAAETNRLNKQQEHIESTAEKFKESGNGISAIEKQRLENMQENASRNIYRQKHDGQEKAESGAASPANCPSQVEPAASAAESSP